MNHKQALNSIANSRVPLGHNDLLKHCGIIKDIATQALQSESESEWISVEDRFPEERFTVLAYHSWSKSISANWRDNNEWEEKINGTSEDITHWMPLPQAPQTPKI